MKRFFLAATVVMAAVTFSFGGYNDVISYGGWDSSSDKDFGSSVEVTIDSTEEGVINSVGAVITKGEDESYSAYASLAVYFDTTTTLEGAESIILTYTSDKQVWFVLPMKGVTDEDGSAHGHVLDPAENKVDTLAISEFDHPLWWLEDTTKTITPLDLSKVISMGWEIEDAPTTEEVMSLSVTGLKIDNITWGDEASPIRNFSVSNGITSTVVTGITNNTVSLSVPTSGSYDVSIFSANGRLIQSASSNLTAGSVASVSLEAQSAGVYFVQVVGQNLTVTEKVTLK